MSWLDLSHYRLEEPVMLWALLALPLLWLLREFSPAGHSPWRSFGALVLRGLALSLCVLAAARPVVEEERPDRSVSFVIDASASLDQQRAGKARTWLEDAWRRAQDQEIPAVAVVAGDELVLTEQLDTALAALADTAPAERGTALRTPLEVALANLPPARHREAVLLSDGAVTAGDLDETLRVAQARDLAVHTVPLGPGVLQARLETVEPEQDRLAGQEVAVRLGLWANAAVEGEVVLRWDGVGGTGPELDRQAVHFGPGRGEASLRFTAKVAGLHALRAELTVSGDTWPQDDVVQARVRVLPVPSALVIGAAGQAKALRAAVAGHRPELRVESRRKLPAPPYDEWTVVALLDPDLKSLGSARIDGLSRWVRDGGRLLITGGDNGLVTDEPVVEPLAELLPVRFPKTKKQERAPLSVVYCLDSSDSMASQSKFELAASAVAKSMSVLPDGARVGVIYFADGPAWAWPLQPFEDETPILAALAQVPVHGGTSIYHALGMAYEVLRREDSLVKHVVLLSDGQSTTTFARSGDIVHALARRDITVTTIAVSKDADRSEMERIARAGGGRAHFAERFTDLPRLFLDEMMTVTRTNKVDERFEVDAVEGARLLDQMPDQVSWPALDGYVKGEQKGGSELALATDDGHPVLVAGRAGRGTIVLFTSDVGGPWSRDWADWPQRHELWDGVVDGLLRPDPPQGLSLETQVDGQRARLVFDAVDPLLNPRNDLVVEALLDEPGGERRTVELRPWGPGRYAADLDLPRGGATLARVAAVGTTARGPAAPGGELVRSLASGPPIEARAYSFAPDTLRDIARRSGGLFDPSPEDLFTTEVSQKTVLLERWAPPLWLALALLLFDLAWRRLRLPDRP